MYHALILGLLLYPARLHFTRMNLEELGIPMSVKKAIILTHNLTVLTVFEK